MFIRCCLLLALLFAVATPAHAAPPPVAPAATPEPCVPSEKAFELPSGSLGLVCKPKDGWNGDVVVFAHGFVDPAITARVFANLELGQSGSSAVSLPQFAQTFGYAFAATTYRRNGLVVQEGIDDVRELIAALPAKLGQKPNRVFLLGVSEGGQIATLFAERNPLIGNGLLTGCAPIGSFQRQIQYVGDFRLLFNYYFPGVVPSDPNDPVTIPAELIANWQSVYVPKVAQALAAKPLLAQQLVAEAGAAIDPAQPTSVLSTTLDVLYYNVVSTNDSRAQLGGNPYDSAALRTRFPQRNLPAISAEITATKALTAYETSGQVVIPQINAHTNNDDIVPILQQQLYGEKTRNNGFVTQRTYQAYGHCTFSSSDLLSAFIDLGRRGSSFGRVFLPLNQ